MRFLSLLAAAAVPGGGRGSLGLQRVTQRGVRRSLPQQSFQPAVAAMSSRAADPVVSNTVKTECDPNTGIATLSMDRAPVNAMNLEFLREIKGRLSELENDKDVRGVIFTSSSEKVFSAGLELTELYQFEEKRLRDVWIAFQELWYKMYTYKLPTASAVTGHAMAAAVAVTTCSDYRVMVDGKFKIGLNEAKFGLVAPFWLMDSYSGCVGQREAERTLLLGTLFTPEEARKSGLVDDLAKDREEAMEKCRRQLLEFGKSNKLAFSATKLLMRKQTIERFQKGRIADTNEFVKAMGRPEMQKALGDYLASLHKK